MNPTRWGPYTNSSMERADHWTMRQNKPVSSQTEHGLNRQVWPIIVLAWLMLLYTGLQAYGYRIEPVAAFIRMSGLAPFTTPPLGLDSIFKNSAFPTLCLFRQLSGIPCFFCGVTRSFVLLNQGHWQTSLQYHLLGIPFYAATLFLALYGPLNPKMTERFLTLLLDKRLLFLLLTLLSFCWLWKLLHNPVFW